MKSKQKDFIMCAIFMVMIFAGGSWFIYEVFSNPDRYAATDEMMGR